VHSNTLFYSKIFLRKWSSCNILPTKGRKKRREGKEGEKEGGKKKKRKN
jgi:hypothetical protein